MKIMKRIAVCLLAFVMAFSVNIPARAAADGELTLENYGDNNENIRISGKYKSLIVEIEMELNGNAYDTTIKLTNTSVTRKLRKYKVELDISGLSYNNNAANNAFGGSDRIPFVFSYYSGWSGPAVFTIKDLDGGQNLKTEEEMKILQPGATLTYSGKFFEKVWGEEPSVKGKSVSVDVTEKVEGDSDSPVGPAYDPNGKREGGVDITSPGLKEVTDEYDNSVQVTSIWSTVTFGNYEQDKTVGSKYEKTPICWLVLGVEGDNVILMSKDILFSRPYASKIDDKANPITWDNDLCELRNYLDKTFKAEAFSSDEQGLLQPMSCVDEIAEGSKAKAGATNSYEVCIPSASDMQKYGFSNYSETRLAVPTEYAKKSNKKLKTKNGYSGYYLRNPGYTNCDAACVKSNGKLSRAGVKTYCKTIGVRPMITVNNSSDVLKYAGTVSVMAKTADGIEAKRVLMSEVDEVFVKKGDTFKLSQVTYEVTNTKKDTVAVCAADKKAKSVTIPSTVKIEGDTYKVTSIKANAFKKCKKLKKINIKSANITSMNKKAFTGLDKGTAIKIKKSKFKKYSKMIKNRDVKVKKL